MYPFNQPYSPEFLRRRPESSPETEDPTAESDPNNPNAETANTLGAGNANVANANTGNANAANANTGAENASDTDPSALPETSPSRNQSETLTTAPEFQDHMSELAGKELPMVHLDQKIAIEPTFDVPDEKLTDGDEVVARGTDSALIRDSQKGNTKILSNYLDDRLWSNEALVGHNQAMTDLHALCLDTAIVDLNSQDQGKLDDAVQKYHQLLEYRDQASPSEQVGINICLGRLMEQGPAFQLIALAGAPKEETPSTEAEAEQAAEQTAEQTVEQVAEQTVEQTAEQATEQAAEQTAEQVAEAEPLSAEELENIRAKRQQFATQLEDLGRQQQTVEHIMAEFRLGGRAVDVDALSEALAAARANLNILEQDNQALRQQIDTLVDDTIDSLLDYNEAEVEKLVANTPELDELMLFTAQTTVETPKWIEARRQQVQQFERQLTEFQERMESIHSQF